MQTTFGVALYNSGAQLHPNIITLGGFIEEDEMSGNIDIQLLNGCCT